MISLATPGSEFGLFFWCARCGNPHELLDGRRRCDLSDSDPGAPPVEGTVPAQLNSFSLEMGARIRERYVVKREIGRGAMGVVYEARDEHLDRAVAIKLGPSPIADDKHHQRFLREARVMADVSDPGTVRVFDFGVLPDQHPYLIMEFLQGESLEQRLDRDVLLSPEDAIDIAAELLLCLRSFHARGLVHRDIKPGNVYLSTVNGSETTVRLLDFGLARGVGAGRNRISDGGEILGTPSYMPPEQLLAGEVDARTDLFAVGALLFEMLTGEPPVSPEEDEKLVTFIRRLLQEPAPKLAQRGDLDARLARVVDRALEPEPGDRHQSASEMLEELLDAADLSRSSSWRLEAYPRR